MDKTLLQRHLDYMARYKGHRQPLVTPCCQFDLVVSAPTDAGDQWDSLVECPNCGEMFMKVVTSTEARGLLLQGAAHTKETHHVLP